MIARVLSFVVLSCGCAASAGSSVVANDAGSDVDAICGGELACERAIYRAEDAEAVTTCLTTHACDVPVERCVTDAAARYVADATVQAFHEACADKDAACGGGLATTVCGAEFALLQDELRAKVQGCLAKDCEIVAECWQTALQLAGCTR